MITGGIKFFEKNLIKKSAEIKVSSGDVVKNQMVNDDRRQVWRAGRKFSESEEIIILIDGEVSFDRLILINHNFKTYEIEYYVDTWVSLFRGDGFVGDTLYIEKSLSNVSKIRLTVQDIQEGKDEAFLGQILLTNEIGTLKGYPKMNSISLSKNMNRKQMLSGRWKIDKRGAEVFATSLTFRDYPAELKEDIDLVFKLWDRDEFYIWPCGGRSGREYFSYTLRGFRLQDIYRVQISNNINESYSKNIYTAGVNLSVNMYEVV